MEIWYTSDSHFDHANIIKYSGRPFKDVEEMNECLIARWNEVVRPSDHIWHLGDLTMHRQIGQIKYRILDRLNGHKRLLLGNHDMDSVEHYLEWFEKIKASHVHDNILFTHIPVHPSSLGRFVANVHGHCHDQPDYKPVERQVFKFNGGPVKEAVSRMVPYLNICVERTHYRPISLSEVKERISACQ